MFSDVIRGLETWRASGSRRSKMIRATGLKEIHFESNKFCDEGTVTIVKALQSL
jgi:hypothetical protein